MIIGGRTMSDDLHWSDEFVAAGRWAQRRKTCGAGGTSHVTTMASAEKPVMTISARYENGGLLGYWTRDDLDFLAGLEVSGAQVSMNYEGRLFTVVVAPGGLAGVVPRKPRPNEAGGDLYYGDVVFWQV